MKAETNPMNKITVTKWHIQGEQALIIEGTPDESRPLALESIGEDDMPNAVCTQYEMDRDEYEKLPEWQS